MNRLKAILMGACLITVVLFVTKFATLDRLREDAGISAVFALYDFGTSEQLNAQMAALKELVTEEVFNQLTIDNEQRTLSVYLKFKQEPVSVKIIKSSSQFVMYTLETNAILAGRKFIFLFNTNKEGKIDWVREVEAIDFIETID